MLKARSLGLRDRKHLDDLRPSAIEPSSVGEVCLLSVMSGVGRRHGRYVIFQMAEVAVPKELFQEILRLIDGLRPKPAPA